MWNKSFDFKLFCFQEVQGFTTVGERLSLKHGEQIVAVLVSEVDRIEDRITVSIILYVAV